MTTTEPIKSSDLEESAQGHDLFRAPGTDELYEQARDQAEASGWLPPHVAEDVPSVDRRQDITKRRKRLYGAMQRLESAVARASGQPDWIEGVEAAGLLLQKTLDDHIAQTEAADGVLDEVVRDAPRLSVDVDLLRRDHQRMKLACTALVDKAAEPDPDPGELRRQALTILGHVAEHRQLGAELLFDAYNVDLGSGD